MLHAHVLFMAAMVAVSALASKIVTMWYTAQTQRRFARQPRPSLRWRSPVSVTLDGLGGAAEACDFHEAPLRSDGDVSPATAALLLLLSMAEASCLALQETTLLLVATLWCLK